jgi:S-adenosylmethionine-diacylglycerol 3-amino-3-carboxypropyl transferase
VLDYALLHPKHIYAVDANPRQNALLELKIAGIRALEFDDFFAVFGRGHHTRIEWLYGRSLRPQLSEFARKWWDPRVKWFFSPHGSFYFHGLSGLVARAFRAYFTMRPQLALGISALFGARSLGEQRAIYDERVAPQLWNRSVHWVLSRQATLSLLGVPHPQRKLVQSQHADGIPGFIRQAVEYVFKQLLISENYFWRVYVKGNYGRQCCPEYLKHDNFTALKQGLVDRISVHTSTVTRFLQAHDDPISRFVLLDHMDWMSCYYPEALVEEWNAILERATPGARILLRSAHARPDYLESIQVGPQRARLREVLSFSDDLARLLQAHDRVHTYAGFVIADAPA